MYMLNHNTVKPRVVLVKTITVKHIYNGCCIEQPLYEAIILLFPYRYILNYIYMYMLVKDHSLDIDYVQWTIHVHTKS